MKKLAVLAVLVLFLAGCNPADSIPFDGMYNKNLNVTIRLGMEISEVEALLGEPTEVEKTTAYSTEEAYKNVTPSEMEALHSGDIYRYSFEELSMSIYSLEGKVFSMVVMPRYDSVNDWMIKGIDTNTPLEDAAQLAGAQVYKAMVFFYYDADGNSVATEEDAYMRASAYLGSEDVVDFLVSRRIVA